MERSKIVVLDFGSQYAHLIAKRFRMLGYYSEIALPSTSLDVFENCKGIVFSGGPSSVYDEKVPEFNSDILNLDIPILGLCYGHYIVHLGYNGKVGKADVGEFGFAQLKLNENVKSPLFEGLECEQQVWMSHQDGVLEDVMCHGCQGNVTGVQLHIDERVHTGQDKHHHQRSNEVQR